MEKGLKETETKERYLSENATASVEEVDVIVDRLRAGKYGKKPPTIVEILSTGFIHCSSRSSIGVDSYRLGTYAESRWSSLTKSGLTMRSNKLVKLFKAFLEKNIESINDLEGISGIVWRCSIPTTDAGHRPVIYISGNLSSVKMTCELVYKPVLTDIEGAAVSYDYIKLGDESIANHMNKYVLSEITSRQDALEKQIVLLQNRIESFKIVREMLSS
jgi:hypothetical protein